MRKRAAAGTLILILLSLMTGCRMGYVLHAARGQMDMLFSSVPVAEALLSAQLTTYQKELIKLATEVKGFGEERLGLRRTENYQKVYLKKLSPIYLVAASPKDRLERKTWWFPVVGDVPYLGFFSLDKAEKEKRRLLGEGLDVVIMDADAYSTLGWFSDPLTLHLLRGSANDMAETILHEMAHTTLYVKGQGEFNEGFAMLVGILGAAAFFEERYGPDDPRTEKARAVVGDEILFARYLDSLISMLEDLYGSDASFEQKLMRRDEIFNKAMEDFKAMRSRGEGERFEGFGASGLNNAYLLAVGLYHRHFPLFYRIARSLDYSIPRLIALFRELAENGDVIRKAKELILEGRAASLHGEEIPDGVILDGGKFSHKAPDYDLAFYPYRDALPVRGDPYMEGGAWAFFKYPPYLFKVRLN
jgi:predicted aminopeptidase